MTEKYNLADFISATTKRAKDDNTPIFGAMLKDDFYKLIFGSGRKVNLKVPVLQFDPDGRIVFSTLIGSWKMKIDVKELVDISNIAKLTRPSILSIHRGKVGAFLYKEASSFTDWFQEMLGEGGLFPSDFYHRTMVLVDVCEEKVYRLETDDIIEYSKSNNMEAHKITLSVNELLLKKQDQYRLVMINNSSFVLDEGFSEVNTKEVMEKALSAAINGVA